MPGRPATRRNSGELRAKLLEAAEQVYLRDGYAQARVADIASEAGVTMSVMYRHFDNKADLLREALLTPFLNFLEEWITTIDKAGRPHPSYQVSRNLVSTIFDNLEGHREALAMLMASDTLYDPSARNNIQLRIGEMLDALSSFGSAYVRDHGLPDTDVGLQTRLLFGMILGVVMWQPWLLGSDAPQQRNDLIDKITRTIWTGVSATLGSPDH